MRDRDHALERISDDFRATTGRGLALAFESDAEWGGAEIQVVIEDRYVGAVGRSFSADEERFVSEAADVLREHWLDEEVWGGWPICPRHGGHPLDPALDPAGVATWLCPQSGPVARIGSLGAAIVSLKRQPR
jgi:hypothetical protein